MCSRLNPYGVIVRYPNELAVDDTIAKNAIVMAQKVYEYSSTKIPSTTDMELENDVDGEQFIVRFPRKVLQ